MKRIIALCFLLVAGTTLPAQQIVKLPAPDKNVPMTLYQALERRQSVREYSDKAIDSKTLGQLLWAASGVNRKDGRMTAPTAINAQDISIYVLAEDGASRYLPAEHALQTVTGKDLRAAAAGRQASIAKAPVILLLVSDLSRFGGRDGQIFGAEDAAYVSQNINLAAVALGLATVPRAMMDKETLKQELGLSDTQVPMLNNPVGHPR